jgi:hypothetical protein
MTPHRIFAACFALMSDLGWDSISERAESLHSAAASPHSHLDGECGYSSEPEVRTVASPGLLGADAGWESEESVKIRRKRGRPKKQAAQVGEKKPRLSPAQHHVVVFGAPAVDSEDIQVISDGCLQHTSPDRSHE